MSRCCWEKELMMNAKRSDEKKGKRDPDLANAEVAFQRAVRQVRERAAKEGLPIATLREGKIVEKFQRRNQPENNNRGHISCATYGKNIYG